MYDTIRFALHDVFVICERACVRDVVHAWRGVAQPTCEAWRKASERHAGVHIMRDKSLARCESSGNGATAKCHEIWRLRAMLSGGFTGKLLGEFMKAMRVYGCYVYVRCASWE